MGATCGAGDADPFRNTGSHPDGGSPSLLAIYHGFAVPILSVPGLFYMDADFGLFACMAESGFVVLTYCYSLM